MLLSLFLFFWVVHISCNFFSVSCSGGWFREWNAKVEGRLHFSFGFSSYHGFNFWTGLFYFCFGHVQDAGWCWQRLYDFVSVVTFHLLYSCRCREHIYNLRWILEHLEPLPRKAGHIYYKSCFTFMSED